MSGSITLDFQRLAAGKELEPRLTQTLALGQDCFITCARGCIWDCRTLGVVKPLDFHQEVDQAATFSLDRQQLVRAMREWPDQELRSHM